MKQFKLWQDFVVEKIAKVGDQVYKTELADDYNDAHNIAARFFKELEETQCILITKIGE